LCLLALGALLLAVQLQAAAGWLVGAAMLVALAMGSMAAVAFGLMMYFARPLRSAADYGIQASLFAIGRIAVPLLGGIALDRFGYRGMLCGLWLAMLLVLLLTLNSRRVIGAAMQGSAAAAGWRLRHRAARMGGAKGRRQRKLGVRLRLKPKSAAGTSKGVMSLESIVKYDWQLAIGDEPISEEEFMRLSKLKVPLARVRGKWVMLDGPDIEKALKAFRSG